MESTFIIARRSKSPRTPTLDEQPFQNNESFTSTALSPNHADTATNVADRSAAPSDNPESEIVLI
ncbi:MAG TPA: hypothetical protein VJ063_02605 [Verrucomicrobiae bacterium]|nr:hypothetical protein [Verrucomicrobiae bacterium]